MKKGVATSGGLIYGKYTITEIKAPDGFTLPDDNEIEVEVSEQNQLLEVVFENEKIKSAIKIIKVDTDDEEHMLADTEFGIYSDEACTQLVTTLITDDKGEVISGNLAYGTYYVKEIKAPEGYEVNDKVYTITVSEAATIMEVIVPNKRILGSIEVIKSDHDDTNVKLKGAVFGLFNTVGDKLDEKTSDQDGRMVFSDLVYGNYVIKELKAPDGYDLDANNEREVFVEEADQVITVFYTNRKIPQNKTGDDITLLTLSILGLILSLFGLLFIQRKPINRWLKKVSPRLHKVLNNEVKKLKSCPPDDPEATEATASNSETTLDWLCCGRAVFMFCGRV